MGSGLWRYGNFRGTGAHRVSFMLAHWEAPTKWVLHLCDITLCVNPRHLFLGDAKSNAIDRTLKGRTAIGGCSVPGLYIPQPSTPPRHRKQRPRSDTMGKTRHRR